jgi:hypothetical protein
MSEGEARNFTSDAVFGSHLLYPKMEGKEIRLEGSSIVNGTRCFELVVTIDGNEVVYFLDFDGFSIRRKVTINQKTNDAEITDYANWKKVNGVTFPLLVEKKSGGKTIQRMEIKEITPNPGIFSWMFKRPDSKVLSVKPRSKQREEFQNIQQSPFGKQDSFLGMTVQPIPSVLNPEIENFFEQSQAPDSGSLNFNRLRKIDGTETANE